MNKKYYIPAKSDIELTGSTNPTYNSYLSQSYFDGEKAPHYGADLTAGMYTAIGDGVVIYVNPTNVGGGIVIRHEWTKTHDLLALYWHGKPLKNQGDKVTAEDYVTNSLQPDKSLGTMGKHTHFELRVVPKGRAFTYNDKYRQCQAIDPFGVLKLRSSSVKVGGKLQNYIEYRGICIDPDPAPAPASPSPAEAFSSLNAEDIKAALLALLKNK